MTSAAVAPSSVAYTANYYDQSVSMVDLATNTLLRTVTLDGHPFDVAVSTGGSRAYATIGYQDGRPTPASVAVINTATGTVISYIPTPTGLTNLVVSPDGSRVYATGINSLIVLDTTVGAVIAQVSVGLAPYGVTVSPDGNRVYVADDGTSPYAGTINAVGSEVTVIDATSNTVLETIPVGNDPFGLAASPDGQRLYVANDAGSVSVINVGDSQVVATIPIAGYPVDVAVSPDSRYAYVISIYGGFWVIDTAINAVVASVPLGPLSPYSVALALDGSRAYVTANNSVFVVDLATLSVIATVDVGIQPIGLSVGPTPPGASSSVTISCANADGAWHNSNVSISCATSVSGSSLANTADAAFQLTTSVAPGGWDSNASTATRTVCDAAGECATAGPIAGNKIDRAPPSVTCPASSIFSLNQYPASVSAIVTDGGSGASSATVSASADTSSSGAHSVSLTASDNVGNTTTHACAYSVAYVVLPFLGGNVDPPPVLNAAKAGSTVPVTWHLMDANGNPISDTASFVSITSTGTSCPTNSPVDAIEQYAGGSGLQYLGNGDWEFNWKTSSTYAGQCRVLRLNLAGGQSGPTAWFTFTK
ncbi:MAG TPA: PxKF domain-containing protein [Galbitalea sp.]|nr:PxKF domain-containing protein [Galbitalea sp.]